MLLIDSIRKMVGQKNDDAVIFCHTDEAPALFPDLARRGEKINLFSGHSDGNVCLQSEHHPNKDLFRSAVYGMDWGAIEAVTDRYVALKVGPTVSEPCRATDRYIVKMERYGLATFDRLPDNVTWWTTNLNVRHPRMRWLPFGGNTDGHGKDIIANFKGAHKKGLLYVNCQPHTMQRARLRDIYRHCPWVTFRENVSVEQYLKEMSEHWFVLSPPGNGLDCYRNWEAIELGTIPVLEGSVFASYFLQHRLPVAVVDNLEGLTQGLLEDFLKSERSTSLHAATHDYWKTVIDAL